MSKLKIEDLAGLSQALEAYGLRSFSEKLLKLVLEEELTADKLGGALIGMGVGFMVGTGTSHEEVRATVETVLRVMPEMPASPALTN